MNAETTKKRKEDKKKRKKRKKDHKKGKGGSPNLEKDEEIRRRRGDASVADISTKSELKSKKRKKSEKETSRKRKKNRNGDSEASCFADETLTRRKKKRNGESEASCAVVPRPSERERGEVTSRPLSTVSQNGSKDRSSRFPYRFVLAPMVGASELAFRLLCRAYGADLCYTPMMSAHLFATDEAYRSSEFQTCPEDRPLVCHFSANRPGDFAAAVRAAAPYCDAVDLNLGCPQRTAFVGHFGSYLLDRKDRELVCQIIRAGVAATNNQVPICCKIRLLDTVEETTELCQQLEYAGASWIAVHARYRASWERQGPGARDGPALLDQVAVIKRHVGIPIIANGNVVSFQDVEANLTLTCADAIMSAEGILDNPTLFLPRWGARQNAAEKMITVPRESSDIFAPRKLPPSGPRSSEESRAKAKRKIEKRLREIKRLEGKDSSKLTKEELEKVGKKESLLSMLLGLENNEDDLTKISPTNSEQVALASLYDAASDMLAVATQYIALVTRFPAKIRTVVFHVRRMLKEDIMRYQLMEELLSCEQAGQVEGILAKIDFYRKHQESFIYDQAKATEQREALERRKREEGKRKAYEARIMRKAKREGKDPNYYLSIGAAVPTTETVKWFRGMKREDAMNAWKKDHSQHCLSYHLDPGGCKRGRTCAFLHVDANSFVEGDEVAG